MIRSAYSARASRLRPLINRAAGLFFPFLLLLALARAELSEGFAPFANAYRGCNDLRGRLVKLVTLDGSVIVEGEVEDVDDAGRLLVATAQGIVPVSSGEAHIV